MQTNPTYSSSTEHDHTSERWIQTLLEKPVVYIVMAAVLLWVDSVTGPFIQFPISFVIPVALSAWYCGVRLALFLAIIQPTVRFATAMAWRDSPQFHWALDQQIINTLIRIVVLSIIAYFIMRTARQNRELARRLRLLGGNVPICIHCKKMQDKKEVWQEPELYIARHSDMAFTHALCPDCTTKNYQNLTAND